MGPLSDALKKLLLALGVATSPSTVETISQPQQAQRLPFTIPPSPTLQQLADSALQAEAKGCLTMLKANPTPRQWDLILAPTASTCVIAGAGSGKSTTLIWRLLVLHKLLRIPLDDMHVFSFTRASTEDFQEKLATQLARWEEIIERRPMTDQRRAELQKIAQRAVSTFHSTIARLCRTALPGGNIQSDFFDLLDNRFSEEAALESFNPFVTPTLSARQAEILNAAHTNAYQQSARYKALVTFLVLEQARQRWARAADAPTPDELMEQWKWNSLLKQEQEYHGFTSTGRYEPATRYPDERGFPHIDPYRAAVADRLRQWGVPFQTFASFPIRCPIPGGFDGQLLASFLVSGPHPFYLHVERYRYPGEGQGTERQRSFHERDRRQMIARYSDHFDWHRSLEPDDFDTAGERPTLNPNGEVKLQRFLELNGYAITVSSAPSVRVRLPGDIRPVHIAELLYQEGVFIESLGLEVEHFQTSGRSLDPISATIAELLPIFWRAFQEELKRQGLLRFHDVLTFLRNEQVLRSARERLRNLKHLFIDEFQDISPEMVDWLAKTLRVHVEDGNAEVSVTAIGDDYQSIYGWRGSHPAFLMNFEQYFPSTQAGKVVLDDNFRSRQPIIDAAEAVLEHVQHRVPKHGNSAAAGIEPGCKDPVCLVEAPLSWDTRDPEANLWHTFSTYVATLLHDLEAAGHLSQLVGDRNVLSIFILARTNNTKDGTSKGPLGKQLLHRLRQEHITRFQQVKVHMATFHRAKGLEADFVLVLDDAKPPEEHPLREMGFSQTPFLGKGIGTYTQNVSDEACRLAYVALTRARFGVMWVPVVGGSHLTDDEDQPLVNGNGQPNSTISSQGCFVLVKRFLQAQGRM